MGKPTVGLTGGIASGKSTVAGFFRDLGIPVVDADAIAREVVEPGTDGLAEIVVAFGEGILRPDGRLDRKRLGAKVFEDAEARAQLDAITHPRIAGRSARRIRELESSRAPYILYEAALLLENDVQKGLDALVVVAASVKTQKRRMRERDHLTSAEAQARIDAQLPLERKVEAADIVIDNDGDLEDTRRQVEEAHRALLARFGGEP